jgi:hypothetical protein
MRSLSLSATSRRLGKKDNKGPNVYTVNSNDWTAPLHSGSFVSTFNRYASRSFITTRVRPAASGLDTSRIVCTRVAYQCPPLAPSFSSSSDGGSGSGVDEIGREMGGGTKVAGDEGRGALGLRNVGRTRTVCRRCSRRVMGVELAVL